MNPFKRMIAGLGAQTAPFGFAPNDPDAAYRAGWGVIGDMGANMLANNQGGVDPFANLGASLQQAKQSSVTRNKEAYTAQRLMEEAAAKKAEREAEAARQKQMEDAIAQLPPEQQALARMVPEKFFGAQVDGMFGQPDLTTDMRNFKMAQENPEFAGFLNRNSGGNGNFGMTPIPLKNAKGEYAVGQFNTGSGGVFLNGAPIDGTDWVPIDPYQQNYAKSSGTTAGKVDAEASAAAPGDIAAADLALEKISGLRDDPNRSWGTGATSIFNRIPGTPGFDYQTKVDEVTAGAFLTAIQELRGLGALSNAEGQTATQAVTRLKTATTEDGFLSALKDYENVVLRGRERARKRLNKNATPDTAPSDGADDPLGLR